MVADAAAAAAQQALASMAPMMQSMMESMKGAQETTGLEEKLEQVVAKVLGSAQLTTTSSTSADPLGVGPEEPLFIPTGIVRDGAESLDVQSAAAEGGEGLDDAASALKALRKRSPRKKK